MSILDQLKATATKIGEKAGELAEQAAATAKPAVVDAAKRAGAIADAAVKGAKEVTDAARGHKKPE